MSTEPITGLAYQEAGSRQTDALQNAELNFYGAWLNCVVLSVGDTAPPATPANGDCYIVGVSATGAWAGHDNALAVYRNGWQFYAPKEGIAVKDLATGDDYEYVSGAWTVKSGGGGGGASIKVTTTVISNTITPDADTDIVRPPALSAALTIANPAATPQDGWPMVCELKDNGTTRALTWGSKYASRIGTLPAATTAGKQHVVVVGYNATDDKLYCDLAAVQA